MKGLNILYVAAWRIFTNLGVAFRLSAAWLAIIGVLGVISIGLSGSSFIYIALAVLFIAAIYIGWHRFCLLGEEPKSWLYMPPTERTTSYILTSIKLILIAIIVAVVVFGVIFAILSIFSFLLISAYGAIFAAILPFIIQVVIGAYLAGIALILPASALKRPLTLKQAHASTMANFGTLLVLSIGYTVLSILYSVLLNVFGLVNTPGPLDLSWIVFLIFVVFTAWFSFIFGIGYISELYGTLVLDEEAPVQAEPTL
ncbi:hypothetical protein ATL17_2797 [Maritalea mobilis]|uniref:DUF4013 domain-containing protein n=1 Tax=Maritalea mobilis TaxID=483324 RepID=A0A4R6VJD0_9HYPH|nr:hypothetical protein [Maritalea mobilis]TDQ61696.1 hypothetical protein ATL17_2797 [Maritalea mobilis]